jgi:uncharacterized membrane protein YqgA involved in biofilm formation
MLGVAVNAVAVIVGSLLGLLFKKGISEKVSSAVMVGVGLCTIYIGITGLEEINPLVAVVSVVVGAVVGTLLDIDGAVTRLGDVLSAKFQKKGDGRFTQGFVAASLLFCVGAMAIVGSISAGIKGDNTTLYTKSILDFTAAIMFASTFGIGVVFSAVPLTIYQGAIALGAGFLEPVLSADTVAAISCVGSIIIMGLGLNIAGVSKFKIANYLPAILLSPFVHYLFIYIGI